MPRFHCIPLCAFDANQLDIEHTKWIVVGAGARDGCQAPIALHEAGLLKHVFTDFYAPHDRFAIANLAPLAIRERQEAPNTSKQI